MCRCVVEVGIVDRFRSFSLVTSSVSVVWIGGESSKRNKKNYLKIKKWNSTMETSNKNCDESSELSDIPKTVIYRKNLSQCSKSFLIDTLLSKNETPAKDLSNAECQRLKKIIFRMFEWFKFWIFFRSGSASPSTSISSSPPISPGNEMNFYQPSESHPFQPSFKYPMNYFQQLHQYPHFDLFQHSRLFYPPIAEFNGLLGL